MVHVPGQLTLNNICMSLHALPEHGGAQYEKLKRHIRPT